MKDVTLKKLVSNLLCILAIQCYLVMCVKPNDRTGNLKSATALVFLFENNSTNTPENRAKTICLDSVLFIIRLKCGFLSTKFVLTQEYMHNTLIYM